MRSLFILSSIYNIRRLNNIQFFISAVILTAAIFQLASRVSQDQFLWILLLYFLSFLAFAKIVHLSLNERIGFYPLLWLALILRALLLFTHPALSDDIYRFLWDGGLWHLGINPLDMTPSQLVESGVEIPVFMSELYPLLNSRDYHTIYPPLNQLFFYISAAFMEYGLETAVLVFKLLLLTFECFAIWFFVKLSQLLAFKRSFIWLYLLNPLVIIEVMGNCHFEGVMVSMLLLTILQLHYLKTSTAGLTTAMAVNAKLLPLMFVPAIAQFLRKHKKERPYLCVLIPAVIVSFVPLFMDSHPLHFFASIDLYFQKFEFNASIYYLTRELLLWITGYNQIAIIGPALAVIATGVIIRLASNADKVDMMGLTQICFLSIVTYLLLSTTIHPWYLILPIALAVFKPRLWMLVWSFTVVMSYSLYDPQHAEYHGLWLLLEYALVFVVWYIEKKYPLIRRKAGII